MSGVPGVTQVRAGVEESADNECADGRAGVRDKLPLSHVDEWDGNEELAGEWFASVCMVITTFKLNADEAMAMMGLKMKKPQLRVWHNKKQMEVSRNTPLGSSHKWSMYKTAFLERFVLGERQKRVAWSRWNQMSMAPQETVMEYHDRLVTTASMLEQQCKGVEPQSGWEDQKVSVFKRGLRAELKQLISMMSFTSLDHALEVATQVELSRDEVEAQKPMRPLRRSTNAGLMSVEEAESGSEEGRGWSDRDEELREGIRGMQETLREGMSAMTETLAALQVNRRGGGRGCHNCGSLEHQVRNCPTATPKKFKCYGCQREGHKRSECPEAARKGGGGEEKKKEPYQCWRCGESDHAFHACPVDKNAVKCEECGQMGHVKVVCRQRKEGMKRSVDATKAQRG